MTNLTDISQWQEFETIVQCTLGYSCHLCRNKKYGYAWRQTLHALTTTPPSGVNFDCPYGKPWTLYGYIAKSQQLSASKASVLNIKEQLAIASRYQDSQSYPKTQWNTHIDVIYPYFYEAQENDDELRFSLRSLANIVESTTVWIVGDKPDWLNLDKVNYIPHQKTVNNRYIDCRAKIKLAAQHKEMGSHFIFMNDDLYFIVPIVVAFLGIPRYFADYTNRIDQFEIKRGFHKQELKGFIALQKKNRPMRNYSLHWPYVYNTKLYLDLYEEFALDNNAFNCETLYYNSCATSFMAYGDGILRSSPAVKEEIKLNQLPKNSLILNNLKSDFPQIKNLLNELFPKPCGYEK